MKIGDVIKLAWRKNYGKARIKQFGELWRVRDIKDKILCKGDELGPWVLVESTSSIWDLRWIHQTNDKDFEIIV